MDMLHGAIGGKLLHFSLPIAFTGVAVFPPASNIEGRFLPAVGKIYFLRIPY